MTSFTALLPGGTRRPTTPTSIHWNKSHVDGQPVWFGVGGTGPPVLFLHGWGLGSRAYKRVLRRLTARGFRVYAPAMPGFGGTAALPGRDVGFAHYADWVDRFLTEVGVAEPVLVIGHSFGGGVATKLAHDVPHRVSNLVLLNAVGGGTWAGRRDAQPITKRPMLDWIINFGLEFIPLGQGIEMLRAMAEDLQRNLVQDPLALVRAGHLARTADLTVELAELGRRGLPVFPMTTTGDGVIPAAAFDALCDAMGRPGTVLPGRHSWLLADPDAFDAVFENIVGIDARTTTPVAQSPSDEILALLGPTTVSAGDAEHLVAGAPALWLDSAPPETLAADLALCHPALAPGEVRAAAREIGDGSIRLTVVAEDRPGLLADTAGVLANAELSVLAASVATMAESGVALHSLTFLPPFDFGPARWEELGTQLRTLGGAGHSDGPPLLHPDFTVRVDGHGLGHTLVSISGPDVPGLLWSICGWFAEQRASIESASITTIDGMATDTFLVRGDIDAEALRERFHRSRVAI